MSARDSFAPVCQLEIEASLFDYLLTCSGGCICDCDVRVFGSVDIDTSLHGRELRSGQPWWPTAARLFHARNVRVSLERSALVKRTADDKGFTFSPVKLDETRLAPSQWAGVRS